VNEVHPALDEHPGAAWFDQARNGVVVRQALLALVLGAA
jgi:aspartate carbamoyltransferase catalytic subunit